jgi:hypothetical protein
MLVFAMVETKIQRLHGKRLKAWYQALKRHLKCAECGFNHPAALHFHHRSRPHKAMTIAEMVQRDCDLALIVTEMAKCKVLCMNCHAVHHYEERQAAKQVQADQSAQGALSVVSS